MLLHLRTFLVSAALLASGLNATADTLTVYTYDSFTGEYGPGPQLEPLFEKHCRCDLVFEALEDGVSILNRLKIEADQTQADVVLGLDQMLMPEARQLGLLRAHGVPLTGLDKTLNWTDEQFLPFDHGYFAFIYNTETVKTPATSLDALVNSASRVIYQDPRTSTPGQGLMTWMETVYGAGAEAAWSQLASHTVTVTKGWWDAYSLFLKGEADYVLSYTTSPAYHAVVENDHRYRAAVFSEGHVNQIEVAGITATSKHPELARHFLAFLISPEAQAIIPVTNWMLPVIPDAKLPDAFAALPSHPILPVNIEQAAPQRAQWIRRWRNAVSH